MAREVDLCIHFDEALPTARHEELLVCERQTCIHSLWVQDTVARHICLSSSASGQQTCGVCLDIIMYCAKDNVIPESERPKRYEQRVVLVSSISSCETVWFDLLGQDVRVGDRASLYPKDEGAPCPQLPESPRGPLWPKMHRSSRRSTRVRSLRTRQLRKSAVASRKSKNKTSGCGHIPFSCDGRLCAGVLCFALRRRVSPTNHIASDMLLATVALEAMVGWRGASGQPYSKWWSRSMHAWRHYKTSSSVVEPKVRPGRQFGIDRM